MTDTQEYIVMEWWDGERFQPVDRADVLFEYTERLNKIKGMLRILRPDDKPTLRGRVKAWVRLGWRAWAK